MRATRILAVLTLGALIALAGCGSSDGTTSSKGDGATSTGSAAADDGWRSVPITDVDGTTFTIAELEGKPVFVENFATWCTNCRQQLGKTQQAAETAGDDAVFVALSVETDLKPETVADYAAENGFDDIRFAVMSPEMLSAMKEAFGTTALNPPSTPKVAVRADGTVQAMVTGFEEPGEIADALAAA